MSNIDTKSVSFELSGFATRPYRDGEYLPLELDRPLHARAAARVATLEEAQQIAALFPKSMRLRAVQGTDTERRSYGVVQLDVQLDANGSHGAINETGIKRMRSFMQKCEQLGFAIEYRATAGNAYPTRELFEAHALQMGA